MNKLNHLLNKLNIFHKSGLFFKLSSISTTYGGKKVNVEKKRSIFFAFYLDKIEALLYNTKIADNF